MSLHSTSFSTIQARSPTGESFSPAGVGARALDVTVGAVGATPGSDPIEERARFGVVYVSALIIGAEVRVCREDSVHGVRVRAAARTCAAIRA